MSKWTSFLVVLWSVFCLWTAAAWLTEIRTDDESVVFVRRASEYAVVRKAGGLAAQVVMGSPWKLALQQGRTVLTEYFNGGNASQASLARAGTLQAATPEDMSLESPVVQEQIRDAWAISFAMPSQYRLADVPRPNDPRVRIVQVPARTFAVRAVAGWIDASRLTEESNRLREALQRDHVTVLGRVQMAQFYPWWSPPFVRRTELRIPIRD